jgi:hypothetical protein
VEGKSDVGIRPGKVAELCGVQRRGCRSGQAGHSCSSEREAINKPSGVYRWRAFFQTNRASSEALHNDGIRSQTKQPSGCGWCEGEGHPPLRRTNIEPVRRPVGEDGSRSLRRLPVGSGPIRGPGAQLAVPVGGLQGTTSPTFGASAAGFGPRQGLHESGLRLRLNQAIHTELRTLGPGSCRFSKAGSGWPARRLTEAVTRGGLIEWSRRSGSQWMHAPSK